MEMYELTDCGKELASALIFLKEKELAQEYLEWRSARKREKLSPWIEPRLEKISR